MISEKIFEDFDDDDCFKVALASRHSGYPLKISPKIYLLCHPSNQSNLVYWTKLI